MTILLNIFLVVVSLFMLVVATTTLVFQLYKWWRPEHSDPRLPGVILVPMRHEEAVAGETLRRLASLNHPGYRVMPIVDHPDDPGAARIAHEVADEVARNIPRDKLIVVHDTVWPDLVHHYGFRPQPVIAHKLDTDPAVSRAVHRIDYLIVPNYGQQDGTLPTLTEARKHAVAVASFGSGDDAVKVYRVSAYWSPR